MIKKSLMAVLALGIAGNCADAKFMDGSSAGLNVGYQFSKAKEAHANFNSPALGAHFDFNKFISGTMYAGVGLDGIFAFKDKKFVDEDGDSQKINRNFTGALTARLGTTMGPVAFDVNGALLGTQLKVKHFDGSKSYSKFRMGFAPGIAMTTEVAKNVSLGLAYRYEMYPKKDGLRLNSHSVMLKASYHF